MRLDTLVLMAFAVLPVARIASQQPARLKPETGFAPGTKRITRSLVGTVVAFQVDSLMVRATQRAGASRWRLSHASISAKAEVPRRLGRWHRTGLSRGCWRPHWKRL